MVSRDVEFDEEAVWNWEAQVDKAYNFFPYFKEEKEETIAPMSSSSSSTPPNSPTSHSNGESSNERPPKMRDIGEIYERAREVTPDNNNLFVFLQIVSH